MELKGKISIVTGGARGIGKSIAASLKKKMSEVIIWDIEEGGNSTAQEIGCKFMKVDVSSYKDVENNTKVVLEEYGKIDILINNAGITRDNLLLRMKEEDFDVVLKVNYIPLFIFIVVYVFLYRRNILRLYIA